MHVKKLTAAHRQNQHQHTVYSDWLV